MDVDMQGQGQGGISNPQSGLPSGGHHPDHPLASMPAARSMSATNMVEPGQTSPYRMGSIVRKGNKARARQLSNAPPPTTATATATATAGAGTGAGGSRMAPNVAGRGMVITRSVLSSGGPAPARAAAGTNDAVLRAMRGGKTGSRVLTPQSTTGIVDQGQGEGQPQTIVQAKGVYSSGGGSGGILRSLQSTLSGLRGKASGGSSIGAPRGQPPLKRTASGAAGGSIKRPSAAPSGRTALTRATAATNTAVLPSVNR